ncbi:MAG: hypothetical protein A2048_02540 [Deltaproteobacteria bacterium GWA2_45_12]|nr:MAG: hypothetical protein A2048_02540 [Deltaproteobacteria bacterium GWA2_45_12]
MTHKFLKTTFLLGLLGIAGLSSWIILAPFPKHRLERLFFGDILPPLQNLRGLKPKSQTDLFSHEKPASLSLLQKTFNLEEKIKNTPNDFEDFVELMHWVRDQFPHGIPQHKPNTQAFDGLALLAGKNDEKFLCGTAAQLLVQAITSVGGHARRVELRFSYLDMHAVVEAYSTHYQKWFVLDPDYDVYYTQDNIPQNALELHTLWTKNWPQDVVIHSRESLHNIYKPDLPLTDPTLIREIFETKNWTRWDEKISQTNPVYFKQARFSVKLLNYYTHLSFPLRTDWFSRPLSWWHPEGNHVQNSAVPDVPTMRRDEDFLVWISPDKLYAPPK